ncbi:MAG: GNAT family N-acetyltransferase [Flavobacteriaceae bacterium]|nr:MAG: GNAT family N-acetyltransferase [Flavobacteriaceae bacterium]
MDAYIKAYSELTVDELYEIMQLRARVFVVEQDCVYLDLDGKDPLATHIFLKDDGVICAYARIFGPGDYFKSASIGRVVVHSNYRGLDLGNTIVSACLTAVCDIYKTKKIIISAQKYLINFYEKHGFITRGKIYLEDGIEHISMEI